MKKQQLIKQPAPVKKSVGAPLKAETEKKKHIAFRLQPDTVKHIKKQKNQSKYIEALVEADKAATAAKPKVMTERQKKILANALK